MTTYNKEEFLMLPCVFIILLLAAYMFLRRFYRLLASDFDIVELDRSIEMVPYIFLLYFGQMFRGSFLS